MTRLQSYVVNIMILCYKNVIINEKRGVIFLVMDILSCMPADQMSNSLCFRKNLYVSIYVYNYNV